MAAEMKSDLLTYTETAEEIGVSPSYIPTLVARGKLKAVKPVGSKKKKYIDRRDIENYKHGLTPAEMQSHLFQQVSMPTEAQSSIFTGKAASTRDIMELINEGYSRMTDSITGSYRDTVSPVIKHVVDTDEEAILKQLSEIIKVFMRNALYVIKLAKEKGAAFTADELCTGLLAGLDLPELGLHGLKDEVMKFLPELLQETGQE